MSAPPPNPAFSGGPASAAPVPAAGALSHPLELAAGRGGPAASSSLVAGIVRPFTEEMRNRQARGKDPYGRPLSEEEIARELDRKSQDAQKLHYQQQQRQQQMRMKPGAAGPHPQLASATASAALAAAGGSAGGSGSNRPRSYLRPKNHKHDVQVYLPRQETFETVDRRRHAEIVLDNPELLMMYAQTSGDSIPATRFKFTRIMCGYEDESMAYTAGSGGYSGAGGEDAMAGGGSSGGGSSSMAKDKGKGKETWGGGRNSLGKRKMPN